MLVPPKVPDRPPPPPGVGAAPHGAVPARGRWVLRRTGPRACGSGASERALGAFWMRPASVRGRGRDRPSPGLTANWRAGNRALAAAWERRRAPGPHRRTATPEGGFEMSTTTTTWTHPRDYVRRR